MEAKPKAAKQSVATKAVPIDTWMAIGDHCHAPRAGQSNGDQMRDLQDQPFIKCKILVVDPNRTNRIQVEAALADLHHELVEAESTEDALQIIARQQIDLILVDINAPSLGAIAFCERVRKIAATRLTPVFIQASVSDREAEPHAFTAGADEFFFGPMSPTALRARVYATLRLKSMMESLDDSESVLLSLAKSVEDRDPDLGQHCQRLALMASALGMVLDLPPTDITSLQRGGYLHDIGKIGIPDRILFKAGPLTAEEWEIMRSHSERGERICACMKSMTPVLPIIRSHHEKWDGTGYPDGLKGEEIPLLARILQTVDIYDALTTERPYKRAYSPEEALDIMREETKKGWRDPKLMEIFADLLPVFRHPGIMDNTRESLKALSETLENYRRNSLRMPTLAAANFNLRPN